MSRKSSLTEIRRAQIITLHGEGYTERDNAAKLASLQDSSAQGYR